jgi:F420-dependent oxidoreductase-like protein
MRELKCKGRARSETPSSNGPRGFAFRVSHLAILTAAVLLTPAPAWSVEFGVQVAPEGTTYEELVETFQLIEKLGYDSAWLNDHFIPARGDKQSPHFESWILLAALAEHTERIRLGTLVSGNTYRHPAVLAKMATTLDYVSKGRLNLGIGAGWEEYEHRAYGIPFYSAHERAERLGEALQVIRLLWQEDKPSFDGEYYDLTEAEFQPKPLQKPHPPIIVGGKGKKWILPLVARYADEWNAPVTVSPSQLKEGLEIIRAECARIERDPCVREVSIFLPVVTISDVPLVETVTRLGARIVAGDVARNVLTGSPDSIKKQIREYLDAGATRVIITTRPGIDRDIMRRFAQEIVPSFRGAANEPAS